MKKLVYLLVFTPFLSCKKTEVSQVPTQVTMHNDSVVYFHDNPNGGIYVITETGTIKKRLALTDANPVVITSPNWGPDRKIYFIAKFQDDSLMQAYSMNIDGSGVTRLTNTRDMLHDNLQVSPSGNKALFYKISSSPLAGMYTINLDGSNEQRVDDYEVSPSWHPDGKHIIYVNSFDTNADGKIVFNIFLMNADGSNRTRITHNSNTDKVYALPFISPDGTKIVFSMGTKTGNTTEVYTANIDGSNEQKLPGAEPGEIWINRNWSKDGQWILINDGYANLWLVKADGSSKRQVANQGSQAGMVKNF
jgi:Tol biopolymer transport system component